MGTTRERLFASIHVQILAAFLLLAGLAFAGYQSLYSSFATYDDEGYVMISLQSFLNGHPLYDTTYTQYGPAYYQIVGLFHRLTQLPITHDVVRFKTLFTWLLTALLAGTIVRRITGNKWITMAAIPIVFFQLDRFGLEPAHPQELCVALTMVCLLLATRFDHLRKAGGSRFGLIAVPGLAGMLVGIILMIKINLGVFLILSLGLAFLVANSQTKLGRSLLGPSLLLALLMPLTLMKNHLGSLPGIQLPLLVVGSTIIAFFACRRIPASYSPHGLSLITSFSAAIFACVAVICLIAIGQGTSLPGLMHGVILQHTDGSLFQYTPLFAISLPCVLLSGWCAWHTSYRPKPGIQKWIDLGVFGLLACLLLRQFTDSFMPLRHGGDDRSLALFMTSVLTPFAWVALIPLFGQKSDDRVKKSRFGRIALCLVAVIQPMQSFPIPGTQVGLGSVCLVLILLISASDAIERGLAIGSLNDRRVRHVMKTLATAVCLIVIVRGATGFQYRSNCVPLELPGASRLCLPAERAKQIQWVVSELHRDNATFIGAPNGYPSFYFWSNQTPPTHLNATYWPALLSAKQQEQVLTEISSRKVAVLVHRDSGNWQSLDTPLVRYLKNNFEPVKQMGSHQIWKRKSAIRAGNEFGMRLEPMP